MARQGKVYVANTSGSAVVEGTEYRFTKGVTRVREGHPLQVQCSMLFDEVDLSVHYEWETATAKPGEQRGAQESSRRATSA